MGSLAGLAERACGWGGSCSLNYCTPSVLIYFIHKRLDLSFSWISRLLGAFILACGTTHLNEVWNIWHASYALAGIIKTITAAISIGTVFRLVLFLPQAIAIPSLVDLQERNRDLEAQIAAHKRFDDAQVDATFRHWMTAGIALAAILIGFPGFLYWQSGRAAAADGDLVAHAHAVKQAAHSALADVVETVTSRRRPFPLAASAS